MIPRVSHILSFSLCQQWLFEKRVRITIKRLARQQEEINRRLRIQMAGDIKSNYKYR